MNDEDKQDRNRKMKKITFTALLLIPLTGLADQPLDIPGFPDVNFVSVGDTVYAFGGTDVDKHESANGKVFNMPYWRCFSSKDLVSWTLESEVHPEQTWIGKNDQCWAGHGIMKNNKWYWYLSDGNRTTAVVVSDDIKGPWTDPLGKPLLTEDMTPTREYDKCIFIDDDGKAYIVFGINRAGGYHIAELDDDMISLKTEPKRIISDLDLVKATDAPFLHKVNEKYYLSSRTEYAIADSINGPYRQIGSHAAGGHGGYFSFHNQTYVNYTSRKKELNPSYRFASLAYVHYRVDGTMVTREPLIDAYGVGRYNANWNKIEAEWFFAMSNEAKKSERSQGGFEISRLSNNAYLNFPNVNNMKANSTIRFHLASSGASQIEIREGGLSGKLLATCNVPDTGGNNNYQTVSCNLNNKAGTQNLFFIFKGEGSDMLHLDWFTFK